MYRVQKVLSILGLTSRRECEKLIIEEKIKINNKLASLGSLVNLNDKITINGKSYIVNKKLLNITLQVIAYNKKIGEIVTYKDPQKRRTVFESLPKIKTKWINIGRLDVNSSGLILFTNNGDLAHKLMHPSSNILRTYHVELNKNISQQIVQRTKKGVLIGNHQTGKFFKIKKISSKTNILYEVILKTGKYREVRRIFNSVGRKVKKLKRTQYSIITLDNLKSGQFRKLDKDEIKNIVNLYLD